MISIPEDIELTEKFRRLVQLFNNTEEKLPDPNYWDGHEDKCRVLLEFEQELIMRGFL